MDIIRAGGSTSSSTSSSGPKFVSVAHKIGSYAANGTSPIDANHQAVTYKSRHYANCKFSVIKLAYANWTPSNDANGANDITVGASIEDSVGNIFPLTFDGKKQVTINPGGTFFSDPLGLSFNESEVFYIRTFISVAVGGNWFNVVGHEYGANEGMAQGDMTVSGVVPDLHEWQYGPMAILGIPNPSYKSIPQTVWIGDSIIAGSSSDYGFTGIATRKAKMGHINFGVPGLTAPLSVTSFRYKLAFCSLVGATHAVIMIGANDFNNGGGVTFATHKANMIPWFQAFRAAGMQVYAATILPRTNSANTTPVTAKFVTGGDRGQYNDWLRAGADGLIDGYIETADAAETGRDTGIWKATYTGDGVHPQNEGADGIGNALDLLTIFK